MLNVNTDETAHLYSTDKLSTIPAPNLAQQTSDCTLDGIGCGEDEICNMLTDSGLHRCDCVTGFVRDAMTHHCIRSVHVSGNTNILGLIYWITVKVYLNLYLRLELCHLSNLIMQPFINSE